MVRDSSQTDILINTANREWLLIPFAMLGDANILPNNIIRPARYQFHLLHETAVYHHLSRVGHILRERAALDHGNLHHVQISVTYPIEIGDIKKLLSPAR